MNRIFKHLLIEQGRLAFVGLGFACFFVVLAWSGIEAFQRQTEPVPLALTDRSTGERPSLGERPAPKFDLEINQPTYEVIDVVKPAGSSERVADNRLVPTTPRDTSIKLDREGNPIIVDGKPWTGAVFDYKPIRPVSTRMMKTTAYSPDRRSCGKWADGITASGKSVWINGGRLVAADRDIPYGTILTIPGYNAGHPVQVWDRGGKIKGNRLDVLYPTHEIALRWGVQDLPVVFWAFVETD